MAPRRKTAKKPTPPNIAGATPLYQDEYEELVDVLCNASTRKAFRNYLNARRLGAGETALAPSVTNEQIQIIRGKAQAFMELLAMCDAADVKSKQTDEGE